MKLVNTDNFNSIVKLTIADLVLRCKETRAIFDKNVNGS